jgi:hypothetical protein
LKATDEPILMSERMQLKIQVKMTEFRGTVELWPYGKRINTVSRPKYSRRHLLC